MDKINFILQQAPGEVTEDIVKKLLEKHDGKVEDVLLEIWKIDIPVTKNVDTEKKKWDDIRDICSSYENEMHQHMQMMREGKSTNE